MTNRLRFSHFLLFLVSVSCLPAQPASAQFETLAAGGRPGTVSGSGDSMIELKPEVMRMHIDLMAKAGSLKEAIKVLKERKPSTRESLEKLGADIDSIEFGQASISDAQSQQQQQMNQMMSMIEQQRGQTGRPTPGKTTAPITVTCSLSAEWKLSADSTEDLLLFVHPLQQKIRDADLSGAKDAAALSPEQQELLEEMQGEFGYDSSYYPSGAQEPGTPVFTFAATISEDEVDRALAEAFQRAKAKAARLSKATGAELGKLVSVTSATTQGEDAVAYEQQYYYAQLMQEIGTSDQNDANEATALKPGTVKKRFTVTAWFDFKE